MDTLARWDAARHALAIAVTIDEVKDIRDKAEAMRLYLKQAGESLEAQNQVAEIKLRAERKAGLLLQDMPKNEGGWREKQSCGDIVSPQDTPQKLEDIGITAKQSSRLQAVAAVGDATFEQHVETVKAGNIEELTTASVLRLSKMPHVAHNSGVNEWYTPKEYIEAARATMGGIDCDPASCEKANETVQAKIFYTVEEDGLRQPWHGNVWMNPPYCQPQIEEFAQAFLVRVGQKEVKQACVLVNNATETKWFQQLAQATNLCCLLAGRVRFLDAMGQLNGAPLQGQVVLYYGGHGQRFIEIFSLMGLCYSRC